MINLLNVCSYIGRGKNLPAEFKYKDKTTHILKYSDIDEDGFFDTSKELTLRVDDEKLFKDLIYSEQNDIIFPELYRNNLILKLIQEDSQNTMAYSNSVFVIKVNTQLYNPNFLFHLLSSEKYKRKLEEEVYKSSKGYQGVFQMRLESLRKFEIPFIPLEEQKKILEQDLKINNKIDELKKQIHTLYDL